MVPRSQAKLSLSREENPVYRAANGMQYSAESYQFAVSLGA